jgi:hypothetical protein
MAQNPRKDDDIGISGPRTDETMIRDSEGTMVSGDRVRDAVGRASVEGRPPAESTRRIEMEMFWIILAVGVVGVLAALYFASGPVTAGAGALVLVVYAIIGGFPRYLADGMRQKERLEAIDEVKIQDSRQGTRVPENPPRIGGASPGGPPAT